MKTPQSQKKRKSTDGKLSNEYKLHINLPKSLVDAIAEEAAKQYRTAASLIRQTLAEKFEKVA